MAILTLRLNPRATRKSQTYTAIGPLIAGCRFVAASLYRGTALRRYGRQRLGYTAIAVPQLECKAAFRIQ
jgi:hypothetical protein